MWFFQKSLIFAFNPISMLTQEKQQTKQKSFFETEKPQKPFIFPKIGILIGFFVILGIGFAIYAVLPEPKSQEDQLTDLIARIEGGEELPSGEWKDYCHLMAVLRDSISPKCVCALDGINWDNPPRSPERLPEGWQEYKIPNNGGKRLFFRHKIYPKIKIDFDANDSQGNEKPHWHRKNPNGRSDRDLYIDQDCGIVAKNSKKSHIYVRLKK